MLEVSLYEKVPCFSFQLLTSLSSCGIVECDHGLLSFNTEIFLLFFRLTVNNFVKSSIHSLHQLLVVTSFLTPSENLKFEDEAHALQKEVDSLIDQGINKIIAVGHSGYGVDLDIAKKVNGIDVIVGGHTETFLYTGTGNCMFLSFVYNSGSSCHSFKQIKALMCTVAIRGYPRYRVVVFE